MNLEIQSESPSYNTLVNNESSSHSTSRENEIRDFAGNGNNSGEIGYSSEFNELSGELNQRITQEMNDLMSSVSSQIQRAISEATNEQVPPQIQATLRSGQGQVPSRGCEFSGRRPRKYLLQALTTRLQRFQSLLHKILKVILNLIPLHYSFSKSYFIGSFGP